MDAYQYFYDADGNETGYQPVGEMHWHAAEPPALALRGLRALPPAERGQDLAVRSTKRSFCLANTDAVDYTLPGADWQPENTDLSTACGGADAAVGPRGAVGRLG